MTTKVWTAVIVYALFIGGCYTWLLVSDKDPSGLVALMTATIPAAVLGIYTALKSADNGTKTDAIAEKVNADKQNGGTK